MDNTNVARDRGIPTVKQTRRINKRAAQGLLRLNRVCIINLNEPYGFQTTFHHGSGKIILATDYLEKALRAVPHKWTLYMAVFCRRPDGREETNAVELALDSPVRAADLTQVIKQHHVPLVKAEPDDEVVSSGWIAFPYPFKLSPTKASRLFDAAIEVSREYENVKRPEAFTV